MTQDPRHHHKSEKSSGDLRLERVGWVPKETRDRRDKFIETDEDMIELILRVLLRCRQAVKLRTETYSVVGI